MKEIIIAILLAGVIVALEIFLEYKRRKRVRENIIHFPKGERVFNDNTDWHKAQAMLRWKNGTLLSEADEEIAREGFEDLEKVKKPYWMQEQERQEWKNK